ncbi:MULTISPECIES: MarR family winged helix-turn-helix transcriptional regulator [unclassified Xanthobacter]|uniref:MarR family winged helix-turn-helix transcriptional regulator n=1 Tax=unclassified Xanthobacter TaxID=2623496 RepID=UPI001EE03378|nr:MULTISPECIES: MarR family transcriptional regulator [unclassified Xanthobacter]
MSRPEPAASQSPTSDPAEAPHSDILTLVHEVAHLMRVRFDQYARQHDMTRAQWVILIRLQRSPGLTQKELAVLLEVEPMTVARLVDRLEASGHVQRRPDPDDRRVWRLHLTDAALPLLDEIDAARREMWGVLVGDRVAPEALAQVEDTLRLMKANLCSEARTCVAKAAAETQKDPSDA